MKTKENLKLKLNTPGCKLNSIVILVKRLLLLAFFCTVFAVAAILIPEKVTYEKISSENYLEEGPVSLYSAENNCEAVKATPLYTIPNIAQYKDNVILKLCEDSGNIGVFRTDGVKIGSVNLCSYAVTDIDTELLKIGISLGSDELYELIGQLEAELTMG